MEKRILTIGGHDVQGRYGVQADCRTAGLIGCAASSVITCFDSPKAEIAIPDQSITPDFVKKQISIILSTQKIQAIKIGLLPSIEVVNIVSEFLVKNNFKIPVILDPVFIPEYQAVDNDFNAFIAAYKRKLTHLVDLLTVSIQEAEILIGTSITDFDSARHAAAMLQTMGTKAIFLKGAQMPSPESIDFYISEGNFNEFPFTKHPDIKPHDRGLSLSTAIACFVANNVPIYDAGLSGRDFIQANIMESEE